MADDPTAQAPGFYRFKIGAIDAVALHDGVFMKDLPGLVANAPEADVKAALREAFLPEDALPITFTALALRIDGRWALIDTGYAAGGPPTAGRLGVNLAAAGIAPADIATVIISHFHGDHINGLQAKDGSPGYPNARIVVPAEEWTFWMDEGKAAAAPEGLKGAFAGARKILEPLEDRIEKASAGTEVLPGVTSVAAPGHTPGHTAFRITSNGETLLYLADVTNHPALFARHPDWQVAFDADGEQAKATRRRLLGEAARDRVRVHMFHAPFPAVGHIATRGDGFDFVPVQWMPAA